jgi:beta-lactamase regulating signal transducer with metallopeptidase domain
MTAADVLDALLKANLASGAAILGVAALRKTARSRFGARLAYGLWLLPVLAGAAVLLPARQVVVRTARPMLSAAVRIGHSLGAPSAAAAAAGPRGLDGPALLVGLWLAGVMGAALVMAVLQHRFIARARRGGEGPAVIGLIAPRILIPRDFAERYSPKEQALVLAHEQAHLARQDSRLNGLAAALQCLGWFNPLVHLGAHLMRIDQELACDEAVANRFPDARRAYAEVLMKAQLAMLPLPLGCYWPSRTQHPLIERVAMLKRPRIGRGRWRAGAVALGCLWAGAGLAAWASQPVQVRTVLKAAPAAEGPGGAKGQDGHASWTAFPFRADQMFHDEAHHIDIFKGNVQFNGYLKAVPSWRIGCDLLVIPSVPPDEPDVPGARKVTWEGHVIVYHGDDAARADYAYYDFVSKTLTLTGHVAVDKGPWVAKNDRLVIHAKDLWHVGGA